ATVTTMVTITDLSGLEGMADPDTILVDGMSELTVVGCDDCDYDWMPPTGVSIDPNGGASTTATGNEAGDYIIDVVVSRGVCTETVMIDLTVEEVLCRTDRVFLPNAFSPNGDNVNDVLRLRSGFTEEILEFDLMIFNRWGQEMYRSFDPQASWDGTVGGEPLEPDVYGFYLRVVCPNEEELIQKGNITILK
ncbi:MAG: gliding motility-associated C-terminal domain-containing protein, partial [Bacteroidota bacterium]